MTMRIFTTCAVVFSALFPLPASFAADLPGTGDDAGKIVVYRDTWGVPHIYAPTVEGGAYAMGWTQAEDRPTQLTPQPGQRHGRDQQGGWPIGYSIRCRRKDFSAVRIVARKLEQY